MSATAPRAHEGDGSTSLMLYLAVFVLLLAFFVLLNAVSTFQDRKVGAVLDSIDQAFSLQADREGAPTDRAREAALADAARALRDLGAFVMADLAVARVEPTGDGRTLVVTLPQDSLFTNDGALRPERAGLLHRVADTLAPRAAGVQVEAELLLSDGGDPAMARDALPVGRAGAAARELVRLGAPAKALSIGLEPGAEGQARLLFTVRDGSGPKGGGRP